MRNDLWKFSKPELEQMRETADYTDKILIDWELEQNVFCPHCGKRQKNDDGQYPCNYHSPDEPEKRDCDGCEETFFVIEIVKRTYVTIKPRIKQKSWRRKLKC